MSTEARRASLPPRPPHAPRTAGNPGPFDPRTPLDEQTDRPASEDTGRVVAPRPASDGPDTGAGGDDRAYRPSGTAGTDRVEAQRPGPDASGDRGTTGAWDTGAGTVTGDSTADHDTATSRASADARGPGAPRTERPHRPSGAATDSGTVGAQRPAPHAWPDGDPRGAAPAEPTHPPTPPATGDARGAGTAERPYRPSGDGPTARPTTPTASEARRTGGAPTEPAHGPAVSEARRTGGVPAEPAHGPITSDARRTGAVSAEPAYRPTTSDARRTGMAPAEPPYRPTGDSTPDREVTPPSAGARPRYPRIGGDAPDRSAPPPQASARFPDAPPTVGRGVSAPPGVGQRVSRTPPAPSAPP
ncbi:hypothetical protein ACWEFQ_18480, partial [Streptomyces albogriseolus]